MSTDGKSAIKPSVDGDIVTRIEDSHVLAWQTDGSTEPERQKSDSFDCVKYEELVSSRAHSEGVSCSNFRSGRTEMKDLLEDGLEPKEIQLLMLDADDGKGADCEYHNENQRGQTIEQDCTLEVNESVQSARYHVDKLQHKTMTEQRDKQQWIAQQSFVLGNDVINHLEQSKTFRHPQDSYVQDLVPPKMQDPGHVSSQSRTLNGIEFSSNVGNGQGGFIHSLMDTDIDESIDDEITNLSATRIRQSTPTRPNMTFDRSFDVSDRNDYALEEFFRRCNLSPIPLECSTSADSPTVELSDDLLDMSGEPKNVTIHETWALEPLSPLPLSDSDNACGSSCLTTGGTVHFQPFVLDNCTRVPIIPIPSEHQFSKIAPVPKLPATSLKRQKTSVCQTFQKRFRKTLLHGSYESVMYSSRGDDSSEVLVQVDGPPPDQDIEELLATVGNSNSILMNLPSAGDLDTKLSTKRSEVGYEAEHPINNIDVTQSELSGCTAQSSASHILDEVSFENRKALQDHTKDSTLMQNSSNSRDVSADAGYESLPGQPQCTDLAELLDLVELDTEMPPLDHDCLQTTIDTYLNDSSFGSLPSLLSVKTGNEETTNKSKEALDTSEEAILNVVEDLVSNPECDIDLMCNENFPDIERDLRLPSIGGDNVARQISEGRLDGTALPSIVSKTACRGRAFESQNRNCKHHVRKLDFDSIGTNDEKADDINIGHVVDSSDPWLVSVDNIPRNVDKENKGRLSDISITT